MDQEEGTTGPVETVIGSLALVRFSRVDGDPLRLRAVIKNQTEGSPVATVLLTVFGPPWKPSGQRLPLLRRLDPLVRHLAGIAKDQALYRLDRGSGCQGWCTLWPWESDPSKTSIYLGYFLGKHHQGAPGFEPLAASVTVALAAAERVRSEQTPGLFFTSSRTE